MHLLGISVFCLALIYEILALESSHDYYDYDYDQDQGDATVSTGKLISTHIQCREIGLVHHHLLVMICCFLFSIKGNS